MNKTLLDRKIMLRDVLNDCFSILEVSVVIGKYVPATV